MVDIAGRIRPSIDGGPAAALAHRVAAVTLRSAIAAGRRQGRPVHCCRPHRPAAPEPCIATALNLLQVFGGADGAAATKPRHVGESGWRVRLACHAAWPILTVYRQRSSASSLSAHSGRGRPLLTASRCSASSR